MQGKKNHHINRILICYMPAVLIALQLWKPAPEIVGLQAGDGFGYLTYHFFHANWWHLALNWWCMAGILLKRDYTVRELVACYMIASIYPFADHTPIVGMSGIVYAMAGFFSLEKKVIALMLLTIALTGLLPSMAWLLHLWCYSLALLFAYADNQQD